MCTVLANRRNKKMVVIEAYVYGIGSDGEEMVSSLCAAIILLVASSYSNF
jgi:hypothetical protein